MYLRRHFFGFLFCKIEILWILFFGEWGGGLMSRKDVERSDFVKHRVVGFHVVFDGQEAAAAAA